jgi:signal peptidase I
MSRHLRSLVEVVGAALLLYIVVSLGVVTVTVNGASMQTTLESGDLLLGATFLGPRRGDVVIFGSAGDVGSGDLIKRVIAVPGDRLSIKGGEVRINGQMLNEDYIPEVWTKDVTWRAGKETPVPAGEYFLMGDNRNHSYDSRAIGFQRAQDIEAVAVLRIWPLLKVAPVANDSHLGG